MFIHIIIHALSSVLSTSVPYSVVFYLSPSSSFLQPPASSLQLQCLPEGFVRRRRRANTKKKKAQPTNIN